MSYKWTERKTSKIAERGNVHVPYKNEGHGRLPAMNSGNTDSMEYILKIILQHDNLTHMDMSIQEKDKTEKRTGHIPMSAFLSKLSAHWEYSGRYFS